MWLSCAFLCLLALLPCASGALAAVCIDLGSEYVKIGLVKPGVPMEIVLNRESNRKTVSIVGLKGQERIFGEPAGHLSLKHPTHSFRFLPDLLGKKPENPIVQRHHKLFPYHSLEADERRGTVVFRDTEGVTHSPEELIAMLLSEAKSLAEKFAEQPVNDAVITVPPYFNQAERRSMALAAEIAGLNLLQLINDNTAAGINYGMFRRKEFNETAQTVMIYDMGATKTTATIFEFQLVKDKTTKEKNPQMTVLGVGYDRTLGGLEASIRLRDYLVKEFVKQGKVKGDPTENPRAMAKLLKEADRVKQVLSANPDHFAQIEGLMEEIDFRAKVTRELFEELCADIFERVTEPIKEALKMAEMTMDQIGMFILMGGATRLPKVQEKLREFLGKDRELGKFLNTDEAIALGGVYQAAHLSKGFKVKKFIIKESTLFPIRVDFHKENSTGDDSDSLVHRTLFSRKNPYPQRKVMTFSRHHGDFEVAVNYGDLSHLSEEKLTAFGSLNISRVDLRGVGDAIYSHREIGSEYKGAKLHFNLDESGILSIPSAEVIFEKTSGTAEEEEPEESTLSKIGHKLTSLFGGGSKDKEGEKDKIEEVDKTEETAEKAESKSEEKKEPTEKKPVEPNEKKSSEEPKPTEEKNATEANKTSDAEKPKGPRVTVVREKIKMEISPMDLPSPPEDAVKEAKLKLRKFADFEKAKLAREKAQNALESFLFDTNDRLDSDSLLKSVTSKEEREKIRSALAKTTEWAEEQSFETPTKQFEDKLKELKDLCKEAFKRFDEAKDRPKVIEALKTILNYSSVMLSGMKNLSGEMQIFTEAEISLLEKTINETEAWWSEKQAEQKKKSPTEPPAYSISAAAEKIQLLDREVKYLLNKAKFAKPKPKVKPNATETTANDTTTKTDEKPSKSGKLETPEVGEETAEETAKREAAESPKEEVEEENREESDGTKEPAEDDHVEL